MVGTMRGRLVALLLSGLVLVGAAGAVAQAVDPDVEAAGRVVLQQLDAFRHDDFITAYTFASANIRQMFDRASFEKMVRGGYPEIARSSSATVDGHRRGNAGEIYLFVRIRGSTGRTIEAVYELVPEGGSWRINGVVTRPDSGDTA
jgi:Domain of unknown function (DUF4864)